MKLKLVSKRKETSGVVSFIFKPESPLKWQAGQFLHYTLHHEPTDDRGSDRWFTISSAPFEDSPMITTRFDNKKSSSFKDTLKDLKQGDEIEAEGPEGDFTIDDPSKDYVFLAGGIGITPFHSIFLDLDHKGKQINVNLLYSNRSEDNIPFKEEFEKIAQKHPELTINYIFSPQRIDETTIRQFVPDLKKPIFYVSGPEPMVEALGDTLKKMGIPENHIKQDFFPGYPLE